MIGLEYGTYPIPQTLEALRAETWITARGNPCSEKGQQFRRALRDVFYIEEADWQQAVLERFFDLFGRLVSNLH
jgi:hypothetical protein